MLCKTLFIALVASSFGVTIASPVPAADTAFGKHTLANGRVVEDLPEGPLEVPANISATRHDLNTRGPNEMRYFINCYSDAIHSEINYYANDKTGSQN